MSKGLLRTLTALSVVAVTFAHPHATAQNHGNVVASRTPSARDAGLSTTPSGSTISLRFRYAQGARNRYLIRSSQTAQGLRSNITQTLEIETERVQPDGSAEQRARTLAFNMESGALPAQQSRALQQAMMGAVFQYRIDPRGHVIARQPVQGLQGSLVELGDQVWQTIEGSIPTLPEAPIAPGASWNETKQVRFALGAARLAMRVDLTYTLREVRRVGAGQTAIIDVAMNLTVTQGVGAPNVTVSGTGRATGEVHFAVDRGLLQRSSSSLSLDVNFVSRGSRPSTMRMTASSEVSLLG
jgi:hypothetical protein